MQHLSKFGAHAGAFARSEDDENCVGSSGHAEDIVAFPIRFSNWKGQNSFEQRAVRVLVPRK